MDRRAFIASGALSLPTVAISANVAAAKPADPHVAWLERWKALTAEYKSLSQKYASGEISNDVIDDLLDAKLEGRFDLVRTAGATQIETVEGAAAAAEMFNLEFGIDAFGCNGRSFEGQLLTNLVNSLKQMALEGEIA